MVVYLCREGVVSEEEETKRIGVVKRISEDKEIRELKEIKDYPP